MGGFFFLPDFMALVLAMVWIVTWHLGVLGAHTCSAWAFGDPLPFCGVLKPLNTSDPALNTLSNCPHPIATIRDHSQLVATNHIP